MNIDELLHSLPSREEIAKIIGMQARGSSASSNDLMPALGIFATGMMLGAGLALLFAPKTGSETRRDIATKAQGLGTQARSAVDEAGQQGRQLAEHAVEAAREMVS